MGNDLAGNGFELKEMVLIIFNVIKRVDGNRISVANTIKERKFDKTFEENFMQKVPETLAFCLATLGNTQNHPKMKS